MRVIPVLDVRGGGAVHADGQDRSRYLPLESVLAQGADPVELARACRERLGTAELYLADLDAIAAAGLPRRDPGRAAWRTAARLVAEVAAAGSALWIDAGTDDPADAQELLEAGATRLLVGLETLSGLDRLRALAEVAPTGRIALGLDVRGERPLARVPELGALSPETLAAAAVAAGITDILVLDLDRVGRDLGPPLELAARLRERVPEARLVAGGGVRGPADLRDLAAAGCEACLVGTAIHRGAIGRAEVGASSDCQPAGSSDSR